MPRRQKPSSEPTPTPTPDDVAKLTEQLGRWKNIARRMLPIVSGIDLCSDGEDLVQEASNLLDETYRTEIPVSITVVINHFDLPLGLDRTDIKSYRVTVKDRNGNILASGTHTLAEDMTPDVVELD